MSLRLGSLFSGAGGLDLAIEEVFGSELRWVSDIIARDKHGRQIGDAPRILAHRFPNVPNLGDITTIDWAGVEPVDIIAGGSPCQDVSAAGKRAGMTEGTRSNLWVAMRDAIAYLQPAYVIWENVRGALSARASSEEDSRVHELCLCGGTGGCVDASRCALESDPRLLGDHRPGVPALRAAGRVCGDLADLGFDAAWCVVPASGVGAPHRRERIFVVAVTRDPARRAEVAGRLRGWPHRWRGVSAPHEERQEANQLGGQSHHQYDDRCAAGVASHAADLWGWPLPTPGADGEASGGMALVAYREGRAQAATHGCAALLDGQAQAGGGDLGIPGASGVRATERAGDGHLGSSDEGHRWCCKGSDHSIECTGCGCDRSDACAGCVAAHPERIHRVEWTGLCESRPGGLGRRRPSDPAGEATALTLLPTPAASNPNDGEDPETWLSRSAALKAKHGNGNGAGMPLGVAVQLLPTPTAADSKASGAHGYNGNEFCTLTDATVRLPQQWGKYAPAIARWEQLTRPAPAPTIPGKNGRPRLNPEFSSWMMGWPAGWVTDVPGMRDTWKHHAIGNGVVPQQAAAAIRWCLAHLEALGGAA